MESKTKQIRTETDPEFKAKGLTEEIYIMIRTFQRVLREVLQQTSLFIKPTNGFLIFALDATILS